MAQTVNNLPAMEKTRVQSLGLEDPLEKEMQPTPVLLPGKSHGWRRLVGYGPWGGKESDMTEKLTISLFFTLMYRTVFWTLWERERVG